MFMRWATMAFGLISCSENSAPPRKSVKSIISSRPLSTSKCTLLFNFEKFVVNHCTSARTLAKLAHSPGRQARQPADCREGLALHGELQRGVQTLPVAQHLHLHRKLVLEVLQ